MQSPFDGSAVSEHSNGGRSETPLPRGRRPRSASPVWLAAAAALLWAAMLAVPADGPATPISTAAADEAASTEDDADSDGGGGERTLLETLVDGGIVGLIIGLLSMVMVYFIVEHFMSIRKDALMPEYVLEDLDQLIASVKVDEAIEYCHEPQNDSMAASCILAGLERYKGSEFGFAEYKSAVEEAGEDQTGRLYRKTEMLGLIGAIAPMLGLTGTVLGMIKAFNQIAAKGGMARPDELAGGIGQALVTTLLGLLVAIPAMIAFSFFRNKIDSIVAEAGRRIEQIMMPLGRQRQR